MTAGQLSFIILTIWNCKAAAILHLQPSNTPNMILFGFTSVVTFFQGMYYFIPGSWFEYEEIKEDENGEEKDKQTTSDNSK